MITEKDIVVGNKFIESFDFITTILKIDGDKVTNDFRSVDNPNEDIYEDSMKELLSHLNSQRARLLETIPQQIESLEKTLDKIARRTIRMADLRDANKVEEKLREIMDDHYFTDVLVYDLAARECTEQLKESKEFPKDLLLITRKFCE